MRYFGLSFWDFCIFGRVLCSVILVKSILGCAFLVITLRCLCILEQAVL